MTDAAAPSTSAATPGWTVNSEAKTTSILLFGGTLTISRRADTKKLQGDYDNPQVPAVPAIAAKPAEGDTPAVEAQPGYAAGAFSVVIPLHHVETVAQAQVEAIKLLTHTLDAHRHTFHLDAGIQPTAGPDPF